VVDFACVLIEAFVGDVEIVAVAGDSRRDVRFL